MNVHITYKVHKTPDLEKDLQLQIDKLRRRLQVFRPELVHLKGSLEQNSAREGTVVALNLRLPSGQLAAQHSAHLVSAALRGAFDELLQQITRHKDLLRNHHRWPRRRQMQSTRSGSEVPFEQTIAAVPLVLVSAEDVRSFVNANLSRLERFVDRELSFRESAGMLPPDTITSGEVVDETIALALGDAFEKPEKLALELWLYRLARRALDAAADQASRAVSAVPLEISVRPPNVRASNEPYLQYHQPDEMLTEEDVLADRSAPTPEDVFAADELVALVQTALRGVSGSDREAFLLRAVEGFTTEEIASITDRTAEEVHHSVARARDHLRRTLPTSNAAPAQAPKSSAEKRVMA
jgi:RNA polymerase sigma factor (sigma-70 family)